MNLRVLESILNDLNSETPDITASAVISTDGLPVASVLQRDTNADRVGGMSAALLALGNRATKELSCGNMTQTVVQGDDGFILLIQAGDETVLVITAKPEAKLGMILFYARQAAENVKKLGGY
ncbi:roadblock/LC7 domain-containing protein [Neisseriaceae bacterium B1]